jgi:hypothetical protein
MAKERFLGSVQRLKQPKHGSGPLVAILAWKGSDKVFCSLGDMAPGHQWSVLAARIAARERVHVTFEHEWHKSGNQMIRVARNVEIVPRGFVPEWCRHTRICRNGSEA